MPHPSKARVGSPAQAARDAKRAIASLARPAGVFDASRYFRGAGDLGFYNTGTGPMRALARSIHAAHCDRWDVDDAMAFADSLIVDRYLEVKSVGIEVVARYRRSFAPKLLARWKRWLSGNHSANWATTDSMCGVLIGPLLVKHPNLAGQMRSWSTDRNLWVRRASMVGLLGLVRKGKALDLVYAIAKRLHADKEDLIQKAVGWVLRDAGKIDPARLERYLRDNGPSIPRTTIRYAIERMSPAKRRELLESTKARPMARFRL